MSRKALALNLSVSDNDGFRAKMYDITQHHFRGQCIAGLAEEVGVYKTSTIAPLRP